MKMRIFQNIKRCPTADAYPLSPKTFEGLARQLSDNKEKLTNNLEQPIVHHFLKDALAYCNKDIKDELCEYLDKLPTAPKKLLLELFGQIYNLRKNDISVPAENIEVLLQCFYRNHPDSVNELQAVQAMSVLFTLVFNTQVVEKMLTNLNSKLSPETFQAWILVWKSKEDQREKRHEVSPIRDMLIMEFSKRFCSNGFIPTSVESSLADYVYEKRKTLQHFS